MKKKLIASAVVSAVAMAVAMPVTAAKPNAPAALPNVDAAGCVDSESGITAYWDDTSYDAEGDTKFGGDLEVDAVLEYYCNIEENSEESFYGSETATVDVDLSQDESDPFFYECTNSGECVAHIDWEDLDVIVIAAAAERWGGVAAAECAESEGDFSTFGATLEDSTANFGVKKMDPGKGKKRQNYPKVYAECDILTSANP